MTPGSCLHQHESTSACWTWPDAQYHLAHAHARRDRVTVGRRRQRLLRVSRCRPVVDGREHGTTRA